MESVLIQYLEGNIPGDDFIPEENKLVDLIYQCKHFFAKIILIENFVDIDFVHSLYEIWKSIYSKEKNMMNWKNLKQRKPKLKFMKFV